MGPKGKPQTPKDKKKKLEPELDTEEKVTELEREFFVFQLAEIDKKLSRLGAREERIKAETAEVEEKIEEFKKEKGTIVTVHEELLAAKEEEKLKKREEMLQLSDEIKIRVEKHQKSIKDLEIQYNKMVTELSAKIEELEEEIRILEDYKQNKVAYNRKLEDLETEMNEAEREHQRNLFKIEQKWENARGRLKKELQSRLLQLSIEFRQTSQKKIGKPCHRVTQENKAIHTALMEMKEEIQQYNEKEIKSRAKIVDLKEHKNKKKEEKDKMIARTIIQVRIIKTLMKKQGGLFEKLKAFAELDATNKMLLKKVHLVDAEIERKLSNIERVKQDIESKMAAMNTMKDAKRYLRRNTKRLQMSARNCLKMLEEAAAVKLITIGEIPEEKNLGLEANVRLFQKRRRSVFEKRGRLLQYLFEYITKVQLSEDDKKLLRSSSESLTLEQIAIGTARGKSTQSVDKEVHDEKESPATAEPEEKGPFVLTSLTSLPRSIRSDTAGPLKTGSEESGVGEEFEEEEEEEEKAGEDAEPRGTEDRLYDEIPGEEFQELRGEEEVEKKEVVPSTHARLTTDTFSDSLLEDI